MTVACSERPAAAMDRQFVVVSGLPGSGKTSLARQLAPALRLPLIDKDDILESLFAEKGTGDSAWRRRLSRESDRLLKAQAAASPRAVLVSFWRVPGMSPHSGTPIEWPAFLSERIVHVRCLCPPATAVTRFRTRERHPGHLDQERTEAEVRRTIEALAEVGPLELGRPIDVDTSGQIRAETIASDVRAAFSRVTVRGRA